MATIIKVAKIAFSGEASNLSSLPKPLITMASIKIIISAIEEVKIGFTSLVLLINATGLINMYLNCVSSLVKIESVSLKLIKPQLLQKLSS